MDFEIRDGLIQMAANTFDHSRYGTEVPVPYGVAEHRSSGRSAPESLALLAKRLPEYVAHDAS